MKRRFFAMLLALTLILSIAGTLPAYAASDEAVTAANALFDLGLFKGTGIDSNGNPIYDLDRTPTREEAVTMLVRLIGKEDEALTGTWTIPFEDVAQWAEPYVGYAYANGLTFGTSATTYSGTAPITVSQYLTFVLRAMGYDSNKDFAWDKAWELTDKLGITNGQYNATSKFSRGDVAIVSYSALSIKPKNSNQTLLESLGLTPKKYVTLKESYHGIQPYYKVNGKTYSGRFADELRLYEYNGVQYAEFNPSLYIEGSYDVRVEGALIILLALSKNLYDVHNDGNPFIDGSIDLDLRPYRTIGMTIKETRNYTSINSYTRTYCYKLNDKELSTPDFGEREQTIDSVRFVKNAYDKYFVSVDDFLSFFGINKTVSLETNSGITYLVIE